MGLLALIACGLALLAPYTLARADATRMEWVGVLLVVVAGATATVPAAVIGTTDTPFLPHARLALIAGFVFLCFSAGRRMLRLLSASSAQ